MSSANSSPPFPPAPNSLSPSFQAYPLPNQDLSWKPYGTASSFFYSPPPTQYVFSDIRCNSISTTSGLPDSYSMAPFAVSQETFRSTNPLSKGSTVEVALRSIEWGTEISKRFTDTLPRLTLGNRFNYSFAPQKPLYTFMEKSFFVAITPLDQFTQTPLSNLGFDKYIYSHVHRLTPEEFLSAHNRFPTSTPNFSKSAVVTVPPSPRKQSTQKISVTRKENQTTAIQLNRLKQDVASKATTLWDQAQLALAYIGLDQMDMSLDERTEILDTMGSALQANKNQRQQLKLANSTNTTAINPFKLIRVGLAYLGAEQLNLSAQDKMVIVNTYGQSLNPAPVPTRALKSTSLASTQLSAQKHIRSSEIDYVQSYEWMRFDPSLMLNSKSVAELINHLTPFSSNILIQGPKYFPLSVIPTEDFSAKSASFLEIAERIPKLAPQGAILGTFLAVGMNVSSREFQSYVSRRAQSFDNEVLTIGAYNKSYGFAWDLFSRIPDEFQSKENFSVEQMRNSVAFLANACKYMGPDYLYTVELHSESTLQYYNAVDKLPDSMKDVVKNRILVIALGGIKPIPDSFGKEVVNIYSQDDIAYKNYGKKNLNTEGYTIKVVDSLVPKNEQPPIIGDHAYLGETYRFYSDEAHGKLNEKYNYLKIKE